MTRLPRDLTGEDLVKALRRLDYQETRTTGSHIRVTCPGPPQHHLTIPKHDPLKVGTLAGILDELARARKTTREELLKALFD